MTVCSAGDQTGISSVRSSPLASIVSFWSHVCVSDLRELGPDFQSKSCQDRA